MRMIRILSLLAFPLLAAAQIPTGVKFVPSFATDGANKFTWPVGMAEIPGEPGHFLVLERNSGGNAAQAKVWRLQPGSGVPWAKSEFLKVAVSSENVSNGETGLLGIAFHPKFRENRRWFIDYNPGAENRVHAVEERRFTADFARDSGIATRLLSLPANGGHNGGTLAFGPDGYLYVSVGDAVDPGNAQKLGSLNGKILRIDVDKQDAGLPYAIPADNPFRAAGQRGEIYALGFRNPWRMSFDPATGALWAGDVGLGAYEEIDKVEKGGNYGWSLFEGPSGSGTCATGPCRAPVLAYGRDAGTCVVGGHVYRSDKASGFYGAYIFGDCQYDGPLHAIMADGAPGPIKQIGKLGKAISSLATDGQGNLYALGHTDGIIYRLDHAELKPGPVGLARGRAAGTRRAAPGIRYRADGVRIKPLRALPPR